MSFLRAVPSRLHLGTPIPNHRQTVIDWAELRPHGGFDFIMADIPWHQKMYSDEKISAKSPQGHYKTMSMAEIENLPLDILAGRDCLLWLWTLGNMIDQAIDVLQCWDFTFCTSGYWTKYNDETGKLAFGTGYVLRGAGEPFLIAKRGNPKTTKSTRSCIMAKRTNIHSQKPQKLFDEAEKLMPDARRIELFSRTERPGWTSWGDQAGTLE